MVLSPSSSVWYNAIVDGQRSPIFIGDNTNIQDGAIIEAKEYLPGLESGRIIIGSSVIIGHAASLDSCEVGEHTLIGMGSYIQDGCKIGKYCIIGAGSIVPPNTVIPDGQVSFENKTNSYGQETQQHIEETSMK